MHSTSRVSVVRWCPLVSIAHIVRVWLEGQLPPRTELILEAQRVSCIIVGTVLCWSLAEYTCTVCSCCIILYVRSLSCSDVHRVFLRRLRRHDISKGQCYPANPTISYVANTIVPPVPPTLEPDEATVYYYLNLVMPDDGNSDANGNTSGYG